MTRIFRPMIQNIYVLKNKALINTVAFSCYLSSDMTREALLLIILSNKNKVLLFNGICTRYCIRGYQIYNI
jgi:hypothetical protein